MPVSRTKPGSRPSGTAEPKPSPNAQWTAAIEEVAAIATTVVEEAEPEEPGVFAPYANRCTFVKKNGEQCKKPATKGIPVCQTHGGQLPSNLAKVKREKVRGALDKFVKPIKADDPEADPITAFEVEFRRTVGRIRYYDELIAKLDSSKDLVWGVTSEEHKKGFDGDDYVNTTSTVYEAKMNEYVAGQWEERKHLLAMSKIWIGAKLDERRLNIMESTVLMLNDAITSIVRGLGQDPNDPEVRQIVRTALVSLPGVDGMVSGS
jgi:hypothetical protein